MKRLSALLLTTIVLGTTSMRADSVFQFGFWGPFLQTVDYRSSVYGLRFDLGLGVNENMYGLDLGGYNRTTGNGRGVHLGVVNETWGTQNGIQLGIAQWANSGMSGFQVSGGYAHAGDHMRGLQLALVTHVGREKGTESLGSASGIQIGVVSQVNIDMVGFQSGIIYGRTYERMSGLQLGLANQAGDANGVQIGLLNIADTMSGVQIGLVNWIRDKSVLKVLPLVNMSF